MMNNDVEWLMSVRNKIRLQLQAGSTQADQIEVAILTVAFMLVMIQNTLEKEQK
jgi:hypothetical protein